MYSIGAILFKNTISPHIMWAKSIAIGKGVGFASIFLGFLGFFRLLLLLFLLLFGLLLLFFLLLFGQRWVVSVGQVVGDCFYHAQMLFLGFLWVALRQMYFHFAPLCLLLVANITAVRWHL